MKTNQVIFIMGVSGTGKSTIGERIAKKLELPFYDGDNHHPAQNIEKMEKGIPLTDGDHLDWLIELNKLAKHELQNNSCIISCSALKQHHRDLLTKSIQKQSTWIYLHGSYQLIVERRASRDNHLIKANLLKSQFEMLEVPVSCIKIDVKHSIDQIVSIAINQLL